MESPKPDICFLFFEVELLLRIYHVFFASVNFYGIVAWGNAYYYKTDIYIAVKIFEDNLLLKLF